MAGVCKCPPGLLNRLAKDPRCLPLTNRKRQETKPDHGADVANKGEKPHSEGSYRFKLNKKRIDWGGGCGKGTLLVRRKFEGEEVIRLPNASIQTCATVQRVQNCNPDVSIGPSSYSPGFGSAALMILIDKR
jgi:hypothetical protein